MKNTIATIFALSLLVFAACKKDTDADSSSFSCKIDGKEFKVKGLLAYATKFSDDFTVYGVNEDNNTETVYVSLPLGTGPGTYTLNADFVGYYVDAADSAFSNLWGDGNGSVTITEIDEKHVAGTFSFDAYDSDTETVKKALTEGKFDVAFR